MSISLFLVALAVGQEPVPAQEPVQTPVQTPVATPAPVAPAVPPFQSTLAVAETTRLALTPKLDGDITPEEWDPFTKDNTYFQWEPGYLYAAATIPNGQELVLSLDLNANGWLVGKDNLEIRAAKQEDGTVKLTARYLDATNVSGPLWVDAPAVTMAAKAVAKSTETETTFEIALRDPDQGIFPENDGDKLQVRIDGMTTEQASSPAFYPRVLVPAKMAYQRAAALPSGLKWNVEGAGGGVWPGTPMRMRFTFNGTDELGLKKLACRNEGFLKEDSATSSQPFPAFDKKKRAFLDFTSPVARNSTIGWRVTRGELTSADNVTGQIQASFRVLPTLDVDVVREKFKKSDKDQQVRFTYYIRSNAPRRFAGTVSLAVPRELRFIGNPTQEFMIYDARGGSRRIANLFVPANTAGTLPMKVRVEAGSEVFEKTVYITIN